MPVAWLYVLQGQLIGPLLWSRLNNISEKFGRDMHVPLGMNCNNGDDPLPSSSGQNVSHTLVNDDIPAKLMIPLLASIVLCV